MNISNAKLFTFAQNSAAKAALIAVGRRHAANPYGARSAVNQIKVEIEGMGYAPGEYKDLDRAMADCDYALGIYEPLCPPV